MNTTNITRRPFHLLFLLAFLLAGFDSFALTTNVWTGLGTNSVGAPDGNWTNSLNWTNVVGGVTNTPATNDLLLFTGTTQNNTTNNYTNGTANLIFDGITFDANAGPFILYGNGITPAAGVTDASTNAETIVLPITLGASHSFNVGATNGNLILSGILSGAQSISQSGLGTLTLSAADTFSGAITGISGSIVVSSTGRLNAGTYAGAISNSGVFNYSGTAAQTLSGSVTNTGTLIFNSGGAVASSGGITGTGGLTQSGAGSLTLTGTDNYTGPTSINAGSLVITTGASSVGGVSFAGGAAVTLNVSSTGAQWTCTNLTFGAGTVSAAFALSQSPSSTFAPLQVNGPLFFTGTLNITVSGNVAMAAGDYPLIKYTGALSGTPPANVTVTTAGVSGATISNNVANQSIDLVIGPGGGNQVSWAVGSGVWDINTTANWADGGASKYVEGNYVVFGDSVTGGGLNTVTLNTAVNPTSVTFDNNVDNYLLGGSGAISGATGLIKEGAGSLTITNNQAYTGATAVNDGTLTLDDTAGASSIISTSSALSLGGGTLNLIGSVSGSTSQTFASAAFTGGNSIVNISGTTPSLDLNALAATAGATVVFSGVSTDMGASGPNGGSIPVPAAGTIVTSTAGGVDGIVGDQATVPGDYATVGLYDWAAISGGTIVGGSQIAGFYTAWGTGNNTLTGNADFTAATSGSHNTDDLDSMRFNTPGGCVVTATGIVTTGGILVTPNVGAANVTITGTAALDWEANRSGTTANYAVPFFQNNSNGLLIFNGATWANGKSGTAGYVFAGLSTSVMNAATSSSYTGSTWVNGDAVLLITGNVVGAPATGATVFLDGGTLVGAGSFTFDNGGGANAHPIVVGTAGGGLGAASNDTFTVDGVISGAPGTGPLWIGIPASTNNQNILGLIPGTGPGTANPGTNANGLTILTGHNTYTGGTVLYSGTLNFPTYANLGAGGITLNGGTLQWGAANAADISAQTVTVGAAGGRLDLNGNSVTFANSIGNSGTGALTVTNGTLTLAAANTFTGGVTVGSGATLNVVNTTGSAAGSGPVTVQFGGTLTGTGSVAGAINVASGGTFAAPASGTGSIGVGTLTVGSGANINFQLTTTANNQIVVSSPGGLTLTPGGAVNLFQTGTPFSFVGIGTYNLIQYSGTLNGLDSTWTTASGRNPHVANSLPGWTYAFASSGGFLTVTIAVDTTVVAGLWTNSTSGNWTTAVDWSSNPNVPTLPGSAATFGFGTAFTTVTLNAPEDVGFLAFTNLNSFAVGNSGANLTLDDVGFGVKVEVTAGTANVIQAPLLLNDNATFIVASNKSISVTGSIQNSNTAKTISVNGGGTLALSGVNTYGPVAGSFGTIVGAGGVLQVGSATALGAGDISISASGTLQAGAALLTLPQNIDVASSATGTLDSQANKLTLNGVISDNGSLVKVGTGTVALAGANTYSGGTTIKAGQISIVADTNLGAPISLNLIGGDLQAATENVVLGATRNISLGAVGAVVGTNGYLDAASAASLTVPGTIGSAAANTGTNNLIVNSFPGDTGTVFLEGPGTFTGTTSISNGILQLVGNANGANPTDNASLASSTVAVAAGAGALVFDFTASTATFGGVSGTGTIYLTNTLGLPVTLTVGANNQNSTFPGGLNDQALGGALVKSGSGTQTLTGSNFYTGVTTVNSGTLAIGTNGILNVGQLAGQGYLVNGGFVTNASTTVNSLGQVANTFVETSGTVNIGELTQANNDGFGMGIYGGTFISPNVLLLRANNYGTTTPGANNPIAALTTAGMYVAQTNAATPTQVYLGQLTVGGSGANSSTSFRMDSGSVTVTNEVLVGDTSNTRWDVMQINGGSFTNLDTNNGIVISDSAGTANGAEFYLSGGSTYAQLINIGTVNDTAVGTGSLYITNAALYVGSGGINSPGFTTLPTIWLESGTLGALGNWSSSIMANGSALGFQMPSGAVSFIIRAADPANNPWNISLTGGILGGAGNLVKTGGGTLTLSGSNTWTGTTIISNGTLLVTSTPNPALLKSSTITTELGTTFDVSGMTFAMTNQTLQGFGTNNGPVAAYLNSQIIAGTNGSFNTNAPTVVGAFGTNTFNNALTLGPTASAFFDLGTNHSGTNDLIVVSGNLSLNGNPIHINALSGTTNLDTTGDYILFKVAGTITGYVPSAPIWGLQPTNAANFSVISNNNNIVLHYSSPSALPPVGVGSITPSPAFAFQTETVSVTVTSASAAISSVVLYQAGIGGTPTFVNLVLTPGTTNVYTNSVSIPNTGLLGTYVLTATVTDANNASGVVPITVVIPPGHLWNGAGPDANWSDAANWLGNVAPNFTGDSVTFDGSKNTSPQMDQSYDVVGLTFNPAAGAFNLGTPGNVLTLTGGLTNNSVNRQIVNMTMTTGAGVVFNAASNDLVFEQPIDNGGATLTITDGGHNTIISNAISDTGGLTKSGAGTNTLYGTNAYTGNTTISAGTLTIGPGGMLNAGTYSGTIANAGTLNLFGGLGETISGVISGAGAFNISGGGSLSGPILTLTGANSFTGNLAISNAYVSDTVVENVNAPAVGGLGNPSTAARTITINNNGLLSLDSSGGNDFGTATSIPAISLIVNQGGVLQITSGNASIGNLTNNGGTIICSPSGFNIEYEAFGLGGFVTTGGAAPSLITNNISATNAGMNLTVNSVTGQTTFTVGSTGSASPDLTVAVPLADSAGIATGSSSNGLVKAGAGTMLLTAQNLFHGPITISAGVLSLGSAETPGVSGPLGISAAVNHNSIVFAGGTLQYSSVNQNDYSGRFSTNTANQPYRIDTAGFPVNFALPLISTGGSLTKLGAGTLTLSAAPAYTGATTISNGTLALGTGLALNSASSLTIAAGGTFAPASAFTLGATASLTAAGSNTAATITGGGAVSLGSRPITLNNYNGVNPGLTISSGALTLNGNAFTVNGAPLSPATYTLIQAVSPVTGSGTFTVTGTAIVSPNIGSIVVNGNVVQLVVSGATTFPTIGTNLVFSVSGGSLKFSWPSSYLGSALQSNSIAIQVTNDWFTIAGSTTVTNLTLPLGTNSNVFFRLNTP